MVGAGASVGKSFVGCSSGEYLLGVNEVKITRSVGAIATRQALSLMRKSTSHLR